MQFKHLLNIPHYAWDVLGWPNNVYGDLSNVIFTAICIASQSRHVNEEICNFLTFKRKLLSTVNIILLIIMIFHQLFNLKFS